MNSLRHSVFKSALGLGIVAIITVGLVAIIYQLTQKQIAREIKRVKSKAILQLVPKPLQSQDFLNHPVSLPYSGKLNISSGTEAYLINRAGNPFELIFPITAHNGYSGDIKLMVGINSEGILDGVRVTEQHETPGLGAQIEIRKSNWIKQFNGKSLSNPSPSKWKVVKDGGTFDQLTGATITSRSIVNGVKLSLKYFKKNRKLILKKTQLHH